MDRKSNLIMRNYHYSFGSPMPNRTFSSSSYRYGFNGKENDNDVKVDGGQQDYGMRIYDPRLGRFLSVDPLSINYNSLSCYQFASNSPIVAIDLDGLEAWLERNSKNILAKPEFHEFAKKLLNEVLPSPKNPKPSTFDCANLGLFLLVKYYEAKEVTLTFDIKWKDKDGNTHDKLSSDDPYFKGGSGFGTPNSFMEQVFLSLGTKELSDPKKGLTKEVKNKKEGSSGDLFISYSEENGKVLMHHASLFYEYDKVTDEFINVESSGAFWGFAAKSPESVPWKDRYSAKKGAYLDALGFLLFTWSDNLIPPDQVVDMRL